MRRIGRGTGWAVLAVLAVGMGSGAGRAASPLSDALSCLDAARLAERSERLPGGLLVAIGRVESGRSGVIAETVLPWPWSINVAGQDQVFPDKASAVRAVSALRRAGVQSIDVGCFQINLMFHPDAFTSLEAAFDPQMNAYAAAAFLRTLVAREGTWSGAIGAYHSSTPARAQVYRAKVMASWPASGGLDGGSAPERQALPVVHAGPPGVPMRSTPVGSATVWALSRQAAGVRVWETAAVTTKKTERVARSNFARTP